MPFAITKNQLLARIRKGQGTDRLLDALIFCTLLGPQGACVAAAAGTGGWSTYLRKTKTSRDLILWAPERPELKNLSWAHYTLNPIGIGVCVSLLAELHENTLWARSPNGDYVIYRDGERVSSSPPRGDDCRTFLDAIVSLEIKDEKASRHV